MKRRISPFLIISISFLITGNLVGAGILALPVNTGLAGFVPSLVSIVVLGAAMFMSAMVLVREAIRSGEETFNYPSLYHNYLGGFGKWAAILGNLLILYGLLTAYLTGGTTIITKLFDIPLPNSVVMSLFFILITAFTVAGMDFVRRHNVLLMIIVWVSFLYIVVIVEKNVVAERLTYADWNFLPATAPIILTAFFFHTIIPQACRALDWRQRLVSVTIFIGMFISLVMNVVWIQAGIGALPLAGGEHSLLGAFEHGLPINVPLAEMLGNRFFTIGSLFFALTAIITSYVAFGTSLLGFMGDLTKNHLGMPSKSLKLVLAFGPPILVSLVYPDIFLKSINVVGGVGIVLLFGVLPSVIAMRRAGSVVKKALSVFMLVFFVAILVFEIAQETGLFQLKPDVEHWNTIYTRGGDHPSRKPPVQPPK